MVQVKFTLGKGDFLIRKHSDGREERICVCNHNVDLGGPGCPSQVSKELIGIVMENDGRYPEELGKRLKEENNGRLPDNRCFYCYGRRHNHGPIPPKEVTRLKPKEHEAIEKGRSRSTEGEFLLHKPKFVRIINPIRPSDWAIEDYGADLWAHEDKTQINII